MLRLTGKSTVEEIAGDQEGHAQLLRRGATVTDGKVHTETREIVVPPEKRVLDVEVLPSAEAYKPGEKAKVKVKLTDFDGKPFVGSTVVAIYDKSVEYISGGSNVPEIKEFFWKWRRHHQPQRTSTIWRCVSATSILRERDRMSDPGRVRQLRGWTRSRHAMPTCDAGEAR